ncbi:MAG: hypothetical protein HY226_02160 [Candidatus Vogelbacteria bacterium]|nr:hypothetical protein [Candidatus Vogelbacteria bacterium]
MKIYINEGGSAYAITAILGVLYAYLTLMAPEPSKVIPGFEMTYIARKVLQTTLIVPIILTWFFAIRTVLYTQFYYYHVSKEPQRTFFRLLGFGIGALIGGFIVATLVGQIRNYNIDNDLVKGAVTIAVNYVYVLSGLVGFGLIYRATRNEASKKMDSPNQNMAVGICLALIIGVIWALLIFTNTSRQVSDIPGSTASFYISDFLIITTVIIPTVVGWFLAVMSALNLSEKGPAVVDQKIRRQFSRLTIGLWFLLFSLIVLNGILAIGTDRLVRVGLLVVLIIIYFFILLVLLAYWKISKSIEGLLLEELEVNDSA